jgi:hypothetical protein
MRPKKVIVATPGISSGARGTPTRPSSPPVTSRHRQIREWIIIPKLKVSIAK